VLDRAVGQNAQNFTGGCAIRSRQPIDLHATLANADLHCTAILPHLILRSHVTHDTGTRLHLERISVRTAWICVDIDGASAQHQPIGRDQFQRRSAVDPHRQSIVERQRDAGSSIGPQSLADRHSLAYARRRRGVRIRGRELQCAVDPGDRRDRIATRPDPLERRCCDYYSDRNTRCHSISDHAPPARTLGEHLAPLCVHRLLHFIHHVD
jgi:hypothetical protein